MQKFYFLSLCFFLIGPNAAKSMEKDQDSEREQKRKIGNWSATIYCKGGSRYLEITKGILPQHIKRPYADIMKKIIIDKDVNTRIHKTISANALLVYLYQNPVDGQRVNNLNFICSLYEKLKDHGCSYVPATPSARLPCYRNNLDRVIRNPSLTEDGVRQCGVEALKNIESFIIDLALVSDAKKRALAAGWIQQAYSALTKQGIWADLLRQEGQILQNKSGKNCRNFCGYMDDDIGICLWWLQSPSKIKNNCLLLNEIFQKSSNQLSAKKNLETRTIMAAIKNSPNRFETVVQETEYYAALSDTQKKKISKVTKKVYRTIEENLSPFWEKGSAEEGNLTVVKTLRKYHRKEENSFRRKKKKRKGQENAPLCVMQ